MTLRLGKGGFGAIATLGLLALNPGQATGQVWTADLYAGGTREGALAPSVGAVNLIANVRYNTPRGTFAYASAAAPLDEGAAPWLAGGLGARLDASSVARFTLGIDLAGHGYGWRERSSGTDGAGATLHALPFLALGHGTGSWELRGGRHEHVYRFGGESHSRGLWEAGGRAQLSVRGTALRADVRWLRDDTAAYPYAGLQVAGALGSARGWASGGRWLGPELAETAWGAGVSVEVGTLGELWSSVQRDVGEPLYGTTPRVTWNVGFSRALRARPRSALAAPSISDGRVVLRLADRDVPRGSDGAPAVAGEFSEWQPVPMRRSASGWVLEVPLARGVHRFAFRTAGGEWFVPDGYPGRMDDGMGGHVAVVVVP